MMSASLLEIETQLLTSALRLAPEFAVFAALPATQPATSGRGPAFAACLLRLELEASWLQARGVAPGLARLAAARAAAQFARAEDGGRADLPAWVPLMAAEVAPPAAQIARHFAADAAELARIRALWPVLGTADALMETGGDIRLARDPVTALNGYGCSHRPRPWAITFASSTASSASARGYVAADRARLIHTLALLRGAARQSATRACLNAARRGIAAHFSLGAGAQIALAASGTDTELLALALTHLAGADRPIRNILIAPEETGRGVPMAAQGLHFAVDTACGVDVTFQAPIEGFRPDTSLVNIKLRGADGAIRPACAVESDIEAAVAAGLAAGQRVSLHVLDLSKTGLLAPSAACLTRLRARHGSADLDIVVDACQTRLSPAALRAYLALDAIVLITGSKFFTGPPFAGAAILPPAIAARLRQAGLPAGLAAYFGRDDFPPSCPAARALPPAGNYGLALRWHAALAEMRAVARIPAARKAEILTGFAGAVRAAIAANPALTLLPAPPIDRADAEPWERLQSIFTFSLRAPHAPERCLTPAEARSVYLWLNADLSGVIPESPHIASRICHIGQPVPLPQPGSAAPQGALRVSAGARLLSGEPAHRGLARAARLAREYADLVLVFAKIGLILRHWHILTAANPAPSFRAASKTA
jgi:hypothetical protein